MDERLRVAFWVLGGTCLFGLIGVLFGALAGLTARMNGHGSGGILGGAVVRAFARVNDRPVSFWLSGAIAGACDGALFLGLVGLVIGAIASSRHEGGGHLFVIALVAVFLLALGATFFGLLAYALIHGGVRAMGLVCIVALLGAVGGAALAGSDGILVGSLAGLLLGVVPAFFRVLQTRSTDDNESQLDETFTDND